MTERRLHAYEVLLRMAQVREIRASVALAKAADEERARRSYRDEVRAAQETVTLAGRRCVEDSSSVDMARYEMLALLGASLSDRLENASQEHISALQVQEESATANVMAKRYRERVDERVTHVGQTLYRERSAKRQEEAIELWLESKEIK
jgi:hypothetical protein